MSEAKEMINVTEEVKEEKGLAITQEQHDGGIAYFNPNGVKFWTSAKRETMQEKAQIIASMNNPTYKLGDVVGKRVILAKDILAHKVQLVDETTGEVTEADRIVIIAPNGETVAGVSVGLKSCINNIMNVFGLPTWEEGLPLFVEQVNTRKGNRTYSVSVALDSKLPKIGELAK
jgi:hypothetical protein